MGRKPIASPFDDYYQGKGTGPSDIDLGKYKGGTEKEIQELMGPRAKAVKRNKFSGLPKEINDV